MPYRPDSFEQRIRKIPEAKPELIFLIEDCSENILNNETLNDETIRAIDAATQSLESLDVDFVIAIQALRATRILSSYEARLVALYILTSTQIGPDVSSLRNALYYREMDEGSFDDLVSGISIPEHTRNLIVKAYRKMKT